MEQLVKRLFTLLGGGTVIDGLCVRTGYDFLYFRANF